MTLQPPPELLAFYALGLERDRLDQAYFPLERERTRELLRRHLPPPPAAVADVGGGAGAYALWLAGSGYAVHLVDPVPLHVEQARTASAAAGAAGLAGATVGDARALPFADASQDALLLLGPLYHLPAPADRQRALGEAARVLRPGGRLLAAGISRFASLLDGSWRGALFDDPRFARMVDQDLRTGVHRNDTGEPVYFTTAYFHRPEELLEEGRAAGFADAEVFAIEGPLWALPDFEKRWKEEAGREAILRYLRAVEAEPSLRGASPHLLLAARKP